MEEYIWKREKTGIQRFVRNTLAKHRSKLEILALSFQKKDVLYWIATITLHKIGEVFSSFDDKYYMAFTNKFNFLYELFST